MGGRFDQFHALEPEKQQRILHAAMAEFIAQGFARASTNAIVQAAGIGKGMLFYYFGSKDELFDFLCEYAMEEPSMFLRRLTFDNGDFLDRFRVVSEEKQRALAEHPLLLRFFESLYRAENAAKLEKFAEQLKLMRDEMHQKLYDGLDYSLLRDDILPEQAITYMRWLLERYEQDLIGQFNAGEVAPALLQGEWQRFYDFLADLRKIFYK